jgi:DNA-binding NtrC family response regulator
VSPTSLLLVDDDAPFRQVMAGELGRLGFSVSAVGSGNEAIRAAGEQRPHVVLLDLQLPDLDGLEVLKALRATSPDSEVILLTGHGSIDTAIEAIRAGAFDYVGKPCPLEELEVRIRRALEKKSLESRASLLERGLTPPDLGHAFVGAGPEFGKLQALIDRVAASESTVLITGETGTGKGMVAKLIHARSPRRSRPFVVVECGALQESLLQSELFGHERGAFTGADRAKPGLFEVAHRGTIFLDEIGEISQATQLNLLRVLDSSTFRHVGGTAEIRVDVRVLAATNRDLVAMVRHGLIREDLYYRLSTISVHLPPLRGRGADVELLARHFVASLNARMAVSKRLGEEALALLRRHSWPGNVRELQHIVEAAVVFCEDAEIRPEHLPTALRSGPAAATPARGDEPVLPTLQELEREHVERVLRAAGGHRGNAARTLGISERNLYRKLREYGLLS